MDDQAAVDALLENRDALPARAGGVDLLSITGSGDSAITEALAAVSAARAVVPQLRVCRLDRDLVGVHEIAERTGCSRQNVSQWTAGARKAQGRPFPAAEGTVGSRRPGSISRTAETPGFQAGRDKVIDELENNHIPGLMKFLAGLDHPKDEQGAHALVVADPAEPARGVMERVSSFGHDVILVTATTDQFMATVLSTRPGAGEPAGRIRPGESGGRRG